MGRSLRKLYRNCFCTGPFAGSAVAVRGGVLVMVCRWRCGGCDVVIVGVVVVVVVVVVW